MHQIEQPTTYDEFEHSQAQIQLDDPTPTTPQENRYSILSGTQPIEDVNPMNFRQFLMAEPISARQWREPAMPESARNYREPRATPDEQMVINETDMTLRPVKANKQV